VVVALPVILREVRLEGFLSHRSTRLVLGTGSYALVGSNGAGKSSIVDALRLALGTPKLSQVRSGGLINHAASRATVAVRLEDTDSGTMYEVVVHLYKKPGGGEEREAELYAVEPGGRRRRLASRVSDVKRELSRILNISLDSGRLLELTAIIPQGMLSSLVNDILAKPSSLKKSLEEILAVKHYTKAAGRLRDLSLRGPEGLEVALTKTVADKIRRERVRLEGDYKRVESEKARLEGRLARLEEEMQALRAELEDLEGAREEYAILQGRKRELDRQLQALEDELARLEREARQLEREASPAERLREEARRLESLASLQGYVEEYNVLREREAKLRARADRLRELHRLALEAQELAEKLEGYDDLKARLEAVESDIRRLREELGRLRGSIQRSSQAYTLLRDRERRLRELLAEAGRPPAPEAGVGEVLEAALSAARELRARAEELREKAERLRSDAKFFRRSAADARERAEKLRGSKGRCPLCGSELPREKALEMASRLEAEAAELERRAREAEASAARAGGEARRLESMAERLREAAGRLEDALQQVRGLRPPEELEAEERRLRGELERLKAEEEGLRTLVGELEKARGALNQALRGLEASGYKPGDADRIRDELQAVSTELQTISERLRGLEARLLEATGAASVEEAVERIRHAFEELQRLNRRLSKAEAARASLETLRRTIGEKREALERLREEARELEARLESLEPQAQRAEELSRRLSELESQWGELRGKLEEKRSRLEELRRKMEAYDALMVKASRAVTILNVLEKAPPHVLQAKLRLLEDYMSEALAGFGLDIASVSFRVDADKVDLVVTRANGSQAAPASLSGGEKTALALAFIVALAKLHSVRAGFLVLDEPTAELDRERRQGLIGLLRSLGGEAGISQVIIVTHDEDVAEAADVVCRVSKGPQGSRVECPEAPG
jgi:exonuclease SbcC